MSAKMAFKNLLAFRLPEHYTTTADALSNQLEKIRFHPCGSQDAYSAGFTQPHGDAHAPLAHAVQGQYLISMQEQVRLLPGSVVKDAVAERAGQVAEKQGHAVGRKQLKEIKEQVTLELLPKAFLKNTQTRAWLSPKSGWLVIEAGSAAKAEAVVSLLIKAMDDFPARRLNTKLSPAAAMTDWLVSSPPAGFTTDRDCELRAPTEDKSAVRYVRHSLEGKDVRDHLAEGKQATRLAMTYSDRISFVLTDKQEIKSVKMLDILLDELDAEGGEDLFNAEFALMAGEYTALLNALTHALGGEAKE